MKKIFLALMIMAPVMTLVAQEQEDETSVIYLGQQQDSASVRQMSCPMLTAPIFKVTI